MIKLREIEKLQALITAGSDLVSARTLCEVRVPGQGHLPVIGLVIGSTDRSHPTLGLFGGVHGLERIGSQVALTYLQSLIEQLRWDAHARRRLETCRIVSIPVVNPGGMAMRRRSNPAGVDLMRNAPVEASDPVPPLLGGHRLGSWLPFYRGRAGQPLEPEAQALVDFVVQEMFETESALSIDFHSGFGVLDRLWYPYARSSDGFPRLKEALNLSGLLEVTYPHNRYRIEPQSDNYTSHGDLWDHLFDLHLARHGLEGPAFLPWTLELGSWAWVRKNPRQLLSVTGPFNPIVPRRFKRVIRRHLLLVDFFLRAVHNREAWLD